MKGWHMNRARRALASVALALAMILPLGAGLVAVDVATPAPAEAHHDTIYWACIHHDDWQHIGGYWYYHDYIYSFNRWGVHYHKVVVTKFTESGVYVDQWTDYRRC